MEQKILQFDFFSRFQATLKRFVGQSIGLSVGLFVSWSLIAGNTQSALFTEDGWSQFE